MYTYGVNFRKEMYYFLILLYVAFSSYLVSTNSSPSHFIEEILAFTLVWNNQQRTCYDEKATNIWWVWQKLSEKGLW